MSVWERIGTLAERLEERFGRSMGSCWTCGKPTRSHTLGTGVQCHVCYKTDERVAVADGGVPPGQQCTIPSCDEPATETGGAGLCEAHLNGTGPTGGGEDEDEDEDEERGHETTTNALEVETGIRPGDLHDAKQWHAWKPETDGRKVPRAPWLTGGDAFVSAQDPQVWTDHDTATKWTNRLPGHGLALNIRDRDDYPDEDLVLVDFDKARDPETGRWHPVARELIERAGSYADVSTSLTGGHILCRGGLPDGVKAIDAALPDHPDFPDAEIEVYDSGRFVAMTGRHVERTPDETRPAQAFIDSLADEFATVAEGTPDELTHDPEKSRAELADVETTSEIQDVFDAIQHTTPRDIRLRSTVTQERSDGSKSLDPAYRNSTSGTGLAQVEGGWIERKGYRSLDALQLVALEDRIITTPGEYPTGESFWRAVEALQERGAHIPDYDGPPDDRMGEPVAVLPDLTPRAQAAANGWDWRGADRAAGGGGLTIDDARERTREAIGKAYQRADNVLIEALPTMGKSYGAVAAAGDADTPISVLTTRGNREQYDQIRQWCDEHGLRAKVLPSFHRDCETANGSFGDQPAEQVKEWYRRGATGREIHIHYEDETGEPIPCAGPAGARCSYKVKWQFDADEYDVLIGNYLHAHVNSVTQGRTVVFDEFPGDAFETTLDSRLAGSVTRFLARKDANGVEALPESYADLMSAREDPQRRADALAWFEDHEPNEDGTLAFDPSGEGHADAPLAAFTLLAGAAGEGDPNGDLGNGWERAELPGGGIGLFDRSEGRVRLLRPPALRYARSAVALDGTPTRRLWELALDQRLNHRSVLADSERTEYIRETLGLNVIRTTDAMKPYSGTTDHVADQQDAALLEAIADEHGQAPALLTTLTAERSHETAGLYGTDGGGGLVDGRGLVSDLAHYGDLKGSNRFASTRLGAVIGSRHFGDGFVEKWGAFAGEVAERAGDGRGADLEYTGIGQAVYQHMTAHETVQALMRFGRDGGGATVYCHTDTLPEWWPLAGEGRVIRTRSDGEQQVLTALAELGCSEWATGDLANHPDVEIGARQVRDHLHRLAERGYIGVETEGNGFVWRDTGLHRVGEHGEVELESVDPDGLGEEETAELQRTTTYTWEFRTSSPQSGPPPSNSSPDGGVANFGAVNRGDPSPDNTS